MASPSQISDDEVVTTTSTVSGNSFWQRRLINPLLHQIKQGATPDKLAQSVAWGTMLGVFPILGTTTMLCGLAGVTLRLNHIAVQTMNWLIYPLQLLLIIPFLRLGNMLFGIEQFPLSLSEITALFEADFRGSLQNMGWLAMRGIVAWMVVTAPAIIMIRWLLTPVFSRLSRTIPRKVVTS